MSLVRSFLDLRLPQAGKVDVTVEDLYVASQQLLQGMSSLVYHETGNTSPFVPNRDTGIMLIDTSIGGISVLLPAAAQMRGKTYKVKITAGTNTITLNPFGAELIDGASTLVFSGIYTHRTIYCDGTQWWTI